MPSGRCSILDAGFSSSIEHLVSSIEDVLANSGGVDGPSWLLRVTTAADLTLYATGRYTIIALLAVVDTNDERDHGSFRPKSRRDEVEKSIQNRFLDSAFGSARNDREDKLSYRA